MGAAHVLGLFSPDDEVRREVRRSFLSLQKAFLKRNRSHFKSFQVISCPIHLAARVLWSLKSAQKLRGQRGIGVREMLRRQVHAEAIETAKREYARRLVNSRWEELDSEDDSGWQGSLRESIYYIYNYNIPGSRASRWRKFLQGILQGFCSCILPPKPFRFDPSSPRFSISFLFPFPSATPLFAPPPLLPVLAPLLSLSVLRYFSYSSCSDPRRHQMLRLSRERDLSLTVTYPREFTWDFFWKYLPKRLQTSYIPYILNYLYVCIAFLFLNLIMFL